jgi:hypothetical protein
MKIITTNLPKKSWFKILKFFYIAAFTSVLLILATIQFAKKPKIISTINPQKSEIICHDGEIYAVEKIKISVWQDDFSSSDDKKARILCKYGEPELANYADEIIEKNYNFKLVQNRAQFGEWRPWIFQTTAKFLIFFSAFLAIRFGFFYILRKKI